MITLFILFFALYGVYSFIRYIIIKSKRPIKQVQRLNVSKEKYLKDHNQLKYEGWELGRYDDNIFYLYRETDG